MSRKLHIAGVISQKIINVERKGDIIKSFEIPVLSILYCFDFRPRATWINLLLRNKNIGLIKRPYNLKQLTF